MLSFIIPTRNRAESLCSTIRSLLEMPDFGDSEIVVVDNNSSDHTREIVDRFQHAKYVKEPRLAFSKARNTGAKNALGKFLAFIDDDVIVRAGTVTEVKRIMDEFPDCGIIAGRIDEKLESPPPDWVWGCQKEFNGWSLYNPQTFPHLGFGFQQVESASGPLMIVEKSIYDKVKGFPPDTVGVETDDSNFSFRKLYVGPGDYGICHLINGGGKKIFYSPKIACLHVTNETRFKICFWRSRLIGEAIHCAVTRRKFFQWSKWRLWREKTKCMQNYKNIVSKLRSLYYSERFNKFKNNSYRMHPDELGFHFHSTYVIVDRILSANKNLTETLWQLGKDGVPDTVTVSELPIPQNFLNILSDNFMYDDNPIESLDDLEKRIAAHQLI